MQIQQIFAYDGLFLVNLCQFIDLYILFCKKKNFNKKKGFLTLVRKLEDNWSKQSGLRAHTSFKMGGRHLGNKMVDIILFFKWCH